MTSTNTPATDSRASQGDPPSSSGAGVPYALCVLVLIALLCGGWMLLQRWRFERERSNAVPPLAIGPALTEFELTERSGQPFRSTAMRGRIWVASYFFTTCPGQCLRLNANIQVLSKTPELEDVTWVSITCDPQTDTVEALRSYADRWEADPQRWRFCRAELNYIQRVAKGMNLKLSLKGHQDYAIVFDRTGKIRGRYDGTSGIEIAQLKNKLLECLNEPPPAEALPEGQPVVVPRRTEEEGAG